MQQLPGKAKQIEAEVPLSFGRVQLVREFWNGPIDIFGTTSEHRLQLALLSRTNMARGCFPDHWGPNRFEPIGELFLFPAQHMVHAKSECRHQNSIVCCFDPESVLAWFDGELKWTPVRLQGSLNIVSPNIRSLLFRIGEELHAPGFASSTMLELMAAQVAIELSRHLIAIEERKAAGGLSSRHLRLIEQRLCDGGAPPTLHELAALCHFSVRHLTRAFRASRGRSIGSYMAERRMDLAKQLLASGVSVKSVAYSTGFSCPSNFAAAFQRATGEAPRQYRQRSRSAASNPTRLHSH
jgi:AraC family transcriptional regulator